MAARHKVAPENKPKMSAQIEQTIEVMNGIEAYRKGSVSPYSIEKARQKAVKDVAYNRNIRSQSVLYKLIRKLRPHVSSVKEFDTLLIAYLTEGSAELREVLLKHIVDPYDRKRIFEAFSSASPKAIDIADPPDRVESTTYRILQDTSIARKIKEIYDHQCQLCKTSIEIGQGCRYAETHHLKPLGKGGPEVMENVLCLCPNHHVMLDYGGMRLKRSDFQLLDHSVGDEFIDYHNTRVFKV